MNKLFRLAISDSPEDQEIAKIFLGKKKNREIRLAIYDLYRYTALRNENFVLKEFLKTPTETYYYSLKYLIPQYIKDETMKASDVKVQPPDSGKYYKKGIKAIKILMKE